MIGKEICKILGKYLTYLSLFLLLPLGVAAYFEFIANPIDHPQPHSTDAFFFSLVIALLISQCFRFFGRHATGQLYRRESIFVVVLIWIVTSFVASFPFYLSGTLTNPVDAYFEAMSGLTTTGSTTICAKAYNQQTGKEVPIHITNPHIPDKTYTYYGTVAPIRNPATHLVTYSGIEAVSKAVLLWRAFLQWVGGMGIVVIFLTVLPALGVGGKFLYQMETTGPIKDGLSPRVQETAALLWKLYLFFTLLEVALLIWTNRQMPFFDAICTSLSNISTGGFSIRNGSILSYHNAATEWIVLAFMVIGSINFTLYFHVIHLKIFKAYVPDFFLFLGILIAGCALVSVFLLQDPVSAGGYASTAETIRKGSFQAISSQTSTGFATANYDRWPFASQMFMMLLMFIGGMSGSTASGIKTPRFYILYKIVLHRLELLYRPDSVRRLKIGIVDVAEKNALTVVSFFCIVAFFAILGTVLYVLDGIDPETSLGLVSCMMNNTGLAFRAAGPTETIAFLSNAAKLISTFWMILGRLEFYVVLLLFLPSFWRGK